MLADRFHSNRHCHRQYFGSGHRVLLVGSGMPTAPCVRLDQDILRFRIFWAWILSTAVAGTFWGDKSYARVWFCYVDASMGSIWALCCLAMRGEPSSSPRSCSVDFGVRHCWFREEASRLLVYFPGTILTGGYSFLAPIFHAQIRDGPLDLFCACPSLFGQAFRYGPVKPQPSSAFYAWWGRRYGYTVTVRCSWTATFLLLLHRSFSLKALMSSLAAEVSERRRSGRACAAALAVKRPAYRDGDYRLLLDRLDSESTPISADGTLSRFLFARV